GDDFVATVAGVGAVAKLGYVGANAAYGVVARKYAANRVASFANTRGAASLWGKSPEEIGAIFRKAGYDVSIRPGKGSSNATVVDISRGRIQSIRVNPGGGSQHAGAPRIVVSTSRGKIVAHGNGYKRYREQFKNTRFVNVEKLPLWW
ncbi:hypothetical protein, partial [Aliiroseovarius halocynthiae]